MSTAAVRVRLEQPSMRSARAFVDAVRRSRSLHGRWAAPPSSVEQYRAFVQRVRKTSHIGHLVYNENDLIAGVININEVVHGHSARATSGTSARST